MEASTLVRREAICEAVSFRSTLVRREASPLGQFFHLLSNFRIVQT